MKIALGTVQFGLNYGVSNSQGQVAFSEVKRILQYASEVGIKTLDSAAAYGNCEEVLGKVKNLQAFNIVTKIPKLSAKETTIIPHVEKSLHALQQNKISTILFHHAEDLIAHTYRKKFYDELITLKQQGIIQHFGASLYQPSQWQELNQQFKLDTLQVPVNCFDQRFISPQQLNEFAQHQVKLHCRSLFLQGLLLMKAEQWPTYFSPFKKQLMNFQAVAKHYNCSLLSLALSILVQKSLINKENNAVIEKIIIGCCSVKQLQEIVFAYQQAQTLNIDKNVLNNLASNDLALINPSFWKIN